MTFEELKTQLKSSDVEERRSTVLTIKDNPPSVKQEELVSLLITAMQDTSWRVRKTAQEILIEDYSPDSYMEGIIRLLYLEDNAGARNSAIETLTRLNKRATPFLITAFKTPNNDVRKFIIDILGQFRDKRALPLMLEALKDEDDNVRASAVEHLGVIGEPSVVDALIEILETGDLWTAYPAADALGGIGDKRALPALIRTLSKRPLREPALRAIGKIGEPESLEYVVSFIDDKSRATAEEALKIIEMLYHKGAKEKLILEELEDSFGDRVITILLEHTRSTKPDVRGSAILLLGLLRDERALEPLIELSEESDFAKDVKRALIFIGKNKPEVLLPLFKKESPYYRRFICEVASEVASPLYEDILSKLINDPDGHVRALAAVGLSNIGDLNAVPLIKALLVDEYEDVQESAIEALTRLKNGIDVQELTDNLRSKDPVLRKNSALLLGRLSIPETVSALGFALKDEDVSVRKSVITALSSIKTRDSIRYLTFALTDEDPDIRVSSALSLGWLGKKEEVEPLCLLLNDPEDRVRAASAKALGIIGDRSAAICLTKSLYDRNGFVITTVIDSLGKIGGDDAKNALLGMLSSPDKEIRRTAIKALSNFDGIEDMILPFLRDDDWATRVAVVEVLGHNPSTHIREELEKLYDEEEDTVVRKTLELINV